MLSEFLGELCAARRIPRATYRLQLHAGFRFAQAEAIVPYLQMLGISDLYLSPVLQARAGSAHGYDITDHSRVSNELGDEEGLTSLSRTARERGLGLLIDMVPNHMGIGADNHWWMDVLKNGAASAFASHFDIDWRPVNPDLQYKLLVPILGEQYGAVLEGGQIQLRYDAGKFWLHYYDNHLPLAPRTYAQVLRAQLDVLAEKLGEENEHLQELRSIILAIENLPKRLEMPPEKIAERTRETGIIERRLSRLTETSLEVGANVEASVRLLNGKVGEPASFDLLDELIEGQSYRPAFWRVAAEEINYRRFFDINDLAAIRPEIPEVFKATHEVILRLLDAGVITGLRIDHPDGLRNPSMYFRQLQEHHVKDQAARRFPQLTSSLIREIETALDALAHQDGPTPWPVYVVAEKILSESEPLPGHWAIQGTTGYEFLNLVGGLFVARGNRDAVERTYREFTGEQHDLPTLVSRCKKQIMIESMASEINMISHRLDRIAERNRRYRDFTLANLTFAVREVIAAMPIYRTYLNPGEPITERDRSFVEIAVEEAKRRNPGMAEAVFDFLLDTLLWRNLDLFRQEDRPLVLDWVLRFQQITGTVMAKGVEDTAFYIFNRLVSLNEVGGHPDHFGVTLEEFHAANTTRRAHWPDGMLATSTHDTKRSEDVRARLNALSEMPHEWENALERWREHHKKLVRLVGGHPAPSANDQYLFYQALLGVWPAGPLSADDFAVLRQRLLDYMHKAAKEAKVHTSWVTPDAYYDAALRDYVQGVLADPKDPFFADFLPFQRRLAWFGYLNSLAQTVLKLTSPGVPDFYQGTELWDFSLVDPDNRRPVDYALRQGYLSELREQIAQAGDDLRPLATRLLNHLDDGRIKLYLTHRSLDFRKRQAKLFSEGSYEPLETRGNWADHVCAFARRMPARSASEGTGRSEDAEALTAICFQVVKLSGGTQRLPAGPETWNDTWLSLPSRAVGAKYRNIYTGEVVAVKEQGGEPGLWLRDVLRFLPVALLAAETNEGR
jgi:(1->4)-alpha-D-glucan 1-alpha-D-glucosylmutase